MSSSSNQPRVTRRTITLDSDKVVKAVASDVDVRIVRPQRQVEYQDPFLGHVSQRAVEGATLLPPCARTSKDSSTVLVINASQGMAQEITVELSRTLPGAAILFAPTLHLALWILKRRTIDIILSSSVLPDGPLSKLHEFLELMTPPPELVVISDITTTRSEISSHPGYRFVELRRVSLRSPAPQQQPSPQAPLSRISELGADIRNDLNNPLQEIVAMAFVAHSSQGLSPGAEVALSAIQKAATNMAQVVNAIEEKIRSAVASR
jgi:hypothetical protein